MRKQFSQYFFAAWRPFVKNKIVIKNEDNQNSVGRLTNI